jgi:flagellar hook-associated protein 2
VANVITSLKEAGLTANYDDTNKRIFVSSSATGKDNDFTLTGGNVDGVNALYKLGLNVSSDATDATYASYTQYYDADGNQLSQNVADAIANYQAAQQDYAEKTAQNTNLTAAYGYASAYSAMQTALESTNLSTAQKQQLTQLLSMTATERTQSVMTADGTLYKVSGTDASGNTIYKSDAGNYIQKVDTYTGSDGNVYSLNDDGDYELNGVVYKNSGETDTNGNTLYKSDDGSEITITTTTAYYAATAAERDTGWSKYTDDAGNTYTQNDTGTYTGTDGNTYKLSASADGNKMILLDSNGNETSTEVSVGSAEAVTETVYTQGAALSGVDRSVERLVDLKSDIQTNMGSTDEELDSFITTLTSNISTVNDYEAVVDTVLSGTDSYSRADIAQKIKDAYDTNGADGVTALTNTFAKMITNNKTDIAADEKTMADNEALATIAGMDTSTAEGVEAYNKAVAAFEQQVKDMQAITTSADTQYNTDAKKIDGTDSKIMLNGIEYTSSLNSYSINGLSINVQQTTGAGDDNAISITTSTDTQGIYDKIKEFLTKYNSLINEITSLYNADSASGYEPLTDDEKDAMSDTEIEKWETKIKDSLLRRDSTLQTLQSTMTSAMSKGIEVNGKTYYLSSFGIKTLGYLNAAENEQYAYHIDGDEDDSTTSTNTDKLMAAITSDPDTVISFMQQLVDGLYSAIGKKMQATTLSSTYTIYNDKEMASEYSDYTETISKWEEKLEDKEDYWYSKFSTMETALSKLNSQTSSLSSLFGS